MTRKRYSRFQGAVAYSLLILVLTLACLFVVMSLSQASLHIPFSYTGDANSHAMLIKSVLDHGWYARNPNLGAPYGQDFRDFPFADNLHLAIVKLFGIFTNDYASVMNLYFILGFPLSALAASFSLRALGISPIASAGLGVIYAFAPYHFIRGKEHLFLASYYAVPPIILIIVLNLTHQGPRLLAPATWGSRSRTLATLTACGLVGSTSSYYALFAALLALIGGGYKTLVSKSFRPAAGALMVALFVSLFQAVNLAPHVLYRIERGPNPEAVRRDVGDVETYGMKLTQLLLPIPDHRVKALGNLSTTYLTKYPVKSEPHPLGFVGAAGFVSLLILAGLILMRGARSLRPELQVVTALSVFALAFATIGGLSTPLTASLSALGFPLVRAWNRMSIFIQFLALVPLGFGIDQLTRRITVGKRNAVLIGVSLIAGTLALLDQTSSKTTPKYAATKRQVLSDREFVAGIEATLGSGAMVYQLPFHPFPESGRLHRMEDYDLFRGYLNSRSLRWSYGGIKGGRLSECSAFLSRMPLDDQLRAVLAVGFSGIYIDRYGYPDRASGIEFSIGRVAEISPVISSTGRLSFFDIRPYRGRIDAKELEKSKPTVCR